MEILIVLLIAAAGVAAVVLPLARGGSSPRRAVAVGPKLLDDAAIDAEVERYRVALRAGTLCGRCRYANPGGSNFCADCGRPISGGAA
jgi:hypothetical protein